MLELEFKSITLDSGVLHWALHPASATLGMVEIKTAF